MSGESSYQTEYDLADTVELQHTPASNATPKTSLLRPKTCRSCVIERYHVVLFCCIFIILIIINYSFWLEACAKYTNRQNIQYNARILARGANQTEYTQCAFDAAQYYPEADRVLIYYNITLTQPTQSTQPNTTIREAYQICRNGKKCEYDLLSHRVYAECFINEISDMFDIRHNDTRRGCHSTYRDCATCPDLKYNNCYPKICLREKINRQTLVTYTVLFTLMNILVITAITYLYVCIYEQLFGRWEQLEMNKQIIGVKSFITIIQIAFVVGLWQYRYYMHNPECNDGSTW